MESQPQNPEFRINSENFHPCIISIEKHNQEMSQSQTNAWDKKHRQPHNRKNTIKINIKLSLLQQATKFVQTMVDFISLPEPLLVAKIGLMSWVNYC